MGPEYIGKIHPNCDYFHGQIPYARGVHLYQVSRASRAADGSGSAGSAESPARAAGQESGESRGGELLTGVTGQKADEDRMEEFPADRTGQESGADQTGPPADDGTEHTYKHAPDLCWYAGKYYIQYLTNPKDEHGGAGVSVLTSSADGREWGDFRISFPEYWIPSCEVTDYKGLHHVFDGTKPAFMHQRMAFYQAKNGVMLVLGFYGWSPEMWMTNWDNYGIGRVVRRLYPDGSLGAIYFIRVNWQGGWKKEQLLYPLYEESGDAEFMAACRELLASPLVIQQWAEENGDRDPMIRVKHPENGTYQAFCWYHRTEREVVGLWKHSYVSESHDGGESWETPVRSPSLVMSGQKIWGCRTSDGRYALVYDPTLETQHRFPLCVVTSGDGLHFDRMLLVHGEVPPIRYEGFCKDLGPQYMRGISEGNPRPDGELCVTYSVNKEDIWFARIPVPICGGEDSAEVEDSAETEDFRLKKNLYHGAAGIGGGPATGQPHAAIDEESGGKPPAALCHAAIDEESGGGPAAGQPHAAIDEEGGGEPPAVLRHAAAEEGDAVEGNGGENFARSGISTHGGNPAGGGTSRICESFFDDAVLSRWNLYKPSWCLIDCLPCGELLVEDREPYDYARLIRLFAPAARVRLTIGLIVLRLEDGKSVQMELCNAKHQTAVRILLRPDGRLRHRTVCELDLGRQAWIAGEKIEITVTADCMTYSYTVEVNGNPVTDGPAPSVSPGAAAPAARFPFMAAVDTLSELSVRTGEARYLANIEQNPDGLPEQPLSGGRLAAGARLKITGICILTEDKTE